MKNSEDDNCTSSSGSSFDTSKRVINQYKSFITICKEKLDSSELPNDFDHWEVTKQYKHLISNTDKYFQNIPESLRFVLPAVFEDGDCGRPIGEKPEWLDMDKFRRGQQFALRYFGVLSLSSLMGLMMIFSFTDGLKALILSQQSSTPYRAFKRYLSTFVRFRNWYTSDPWSVETPANRDIRDVRTMHRDMRRKLCDMGPEMIDRASKIQNACYPLLDKITTDFKNACPPMKSLQCPYTIGRMTAINQGDMSGTQFACMGLLLLYPEKFGVHGASEKDLEAFCHLWRGLGHLLGIEDHYNFCRGSLQDVRQRARDFVEHWVKPNFRTVTPEWEHMIRCLFYGAGGITHFTHYKLVLLLLCTMCQLNMPGLYASLSRWEKIVYILIKFLLTYLVKLPGMMFILNKVIHMLMNRAINFKPKDLFKLEEGLKMFPKLTVMNTQPF